MWLLAVVAPVAFSWQVLDVQWPGGRAQCLVVVEDTLRLEALSGPTRVQAEVHAENINRVLARGETPSPRQTLEYLSLAQGAPKVVLARLWFLYPEGARVRATYLSDSSVDGRGMSLWDEATGSELRIVHWLGHDEELKSLVEGLFKARDPESREAAQKALERKARERRRCQRIAVGVAGRVESLPCNAGTAELEQAVASLRPLLPEEAQKRFGDALRLMARARFGAASGGAAFPHLILFRSLAISPETLGAAVAPVSLVQKAPADPKEFLSWRPPEGEVLRPFLGKEQFEPADLALEFPQLLRRYR